MLRDLPTAETGCLLIADVSGYTSYLLGSELEHAEDVLADLTETIVGALSPTFHIAKLEGDAVFAYVPSESTEASMVLDTVEHTYFAFRDRLRDVVQATTCDCNACRLMPSLDLKVVAHSGRYVRKEVAGGEELTGPDVVVVHRLLKNSVKEELGLTAYALLTEACVEALGIDPSALGLLGHIERSEDVGEVRCHVEDLEARWRRELERRRRVVLPDQAEFEFRREIPVAAPVLWDYHTSPEKRLLWQTDFTRIDQSNPDGRRGPGTTNHCVHGKGVIVEEILDWRPFRYFTVRTVVPMIGPWVGTIEFVEIDDRRTEVHVRNERLSGMKRRLLWALMRRPLMSTMTKSYDRLGEGLLANEPVSLDASLH